VERPRSLTPHVPRGTSLGDYILDIRKIEKAE
jgi:hypothetical protein